MSELHYHVIETLHDDYLGPYLDRFQDDFPANEQIYISNFLRMLKKKEQQNPSGPTLLCALEGAEGPLVGMACYDIRKENQAVILWYLSIAPEKRSQTLGSRLYQEIVRRAREKHSESRFLIYEVERPDQAHTPEDADMARRRIGFYQRNGGQVCANMVYWQQVRREPRIMMYLMAHAFQPEDRKPDVVLEAVRGAFGGSLESGEILILE